MSTFASRTGQVFTHLSCFIFSVLLFGQADGSTKLTRLYVEPFTTRWSAEQLRRDVVSELNRRHSISLVTNPAAADAVLAGGGEVWVRGYRSLNPRSGRSPSGGIAVYDGYLSVELKDSRGRTFWSYLATPSSAPGDVNRDLAKQIGRHVAEAMQAGEPGQFAVEASQPATVLKGAGATFPAPVYDKWFKNYRVENPNLEIRYDAVGSEAGIRDLLAGKVDFGATDSPEAIRDLAPSDQDRYLLLPTVVGAVVPIVNLPGVAGVIGLTPEALAGIYLGKIRKWNDPVLRRSNRGLRLPDLDITVVYRSDGSGTSYAFTDFLSQTSADWKTQVGAHLGPRWPLGKGASGNDGVAKMVKELGGSIGYVEYVYALQNHLSFARVQNRQGEFIGASLESMAVAATTAVKMSDNFKASIVNAPGAGAYPIASFTWLVIPKKTMSPATSQALRGFVEWMLGPGQGQAAALGYLALPKEVAARVETAVKDLAPRTKI